MKELQLLTNALDVASKAGVFGLQDSASILQAITTLGEILQAGAAANQTVETTAAKIPEGKPTLKRAAKKPAAKKPTLKD